MRYVPKVCIQHLILGAYQNENQIMMAWQLQN